MQGRGGGRKEGEEGVSDRATVRAEGEAARAGSHFIQHEDEGAARCPDAAPLLLQGLLQEELCFVAVLRRAQPCGQGSHVSGGEEGSSVEQDLRQGAGVSQGRAPPVPCPSPGSSAP